MKARYPIAYSVMIR